MRRADVAADEALAGRRAEPAAAPAGDAAKCTTARRRVSSEQLFAGAAEVQIEHRGALYRLKQTALGKLILTK